MDIVQGSLLVSGIGITLIPLEWIQTLFIDKSIPLSIWTLLIPFIGICMVGISLLSYHKDALRVIFYGVCKTIDQTGLGLGIVSDVFGAVGGNNHINPVEGFTATSEL
jgi:hypothetical protein